MKGKIEMFRGRDQTRPAGSMSDADQKIFGADDLPLPDGQRMAVKPLPIAQIVPDMTQPRRIIPWQVRDVPTNSAADLLKRWIFKAEEESKLPIDIPSILDPSDDSDERSETPGPIEAALRTFLDFVGSIYRDGLNNPITVYRTDFGYEIEMGERRWYAFQFLRMYTDDPKWDRIPARVVPTPDPWRQASENGQRQDLNAIGRARQFAKLVMSSYQDQADFVPYEEAGGDRAYYAQVADEVMFRLRKGMSDRIMTAMGVTNRSALSRYRQLLKVTDEIWHQADMLNLSYDDILRLSKIVASRNNSTVPDSPTGDSTPGTNRHFREVARLVETARADDPETNRAALARLTELDRWVKSAIDRIKQWED